jgi:hypothetical protein
MFDKNFIEGLPEIPGLAGKKICDSLMVVIVEALNSEDEQEAYEIILRGMGLLSAFADSFGMEIHFPLLGPSRRENLSKIKDFLLETRAIFDQTFMTTSSKEFKRLIDNKFPGEFRFKFTDGDLNRIQTLINELRQIISTTEGLTEDHKSRLLDRLEKLQSELHKSISDLDKFWGLLIDASITFKKVGENAKPIIDRVREIIDIVWRVQIRTEELPSNTPMELPSGKE